MARKLKVYQTALGFFDEAIAAPSTKAALEAWGSNSNLFQQRCEQELAKAQAACDKAQQEPEARVSAIEAARAAVEDRARAEDARWQKQKRKLDSRCAAGGVSARTTNGNLVGRTTN